MREAERFTLATITTIAVYEATAQPDELISNAIRRARNQRPHTIRIALLLLANHFAWDPPTWADPISLIGTAYTHAKRAIHRWP